MMTDQSSPPRFANKTALITGAASGIGRAAAYRLAREAAQVIIADRDVQAGRQAAERITRQGGKAAFMAVDLNDDEQIAGLAQRISDQYHCLHILVNNAFINIKGRIETGSWQADWEAGVRIGLKAPALLAELTLPLMRKEGAAIINISSDGGFRGRAGMWLYDAMKAAIVSLTKTMAAEFVQYQIRANAIAPGWIATEIHAQDHADTAARLKELAGMETDHNLMRRLGRPEEIADGIAFLASEEASFITGTTLHIDGGRVGINTVPASLWPRADSAG